jgi:diguanylate cyclase (GGDEF)-like protein
MPTDPRIEGAARRDPADSAHQQAGTDVAQADSTRRRAGAEARRTADARAHLRLAAVRALPRALLALPARARGRRGDHRFFTAVTVALVIGGALAAVLGARAVASSETQKARLAFHLSSEEIASTLQLSIQHEEDLVIAASAYVASNPHASPAEFDRWATSVQAMQRYPELENIGLVRLVPGSQLASFERYIAQHPVRPLGPNSVAPVEGFEVLPPGRRPYYCFAVAGLARSTVTYIPAGSDYCALAPQLMAGRDSGVASYAPFQSGGTTTLGVSTPVYHGGVAPSTVGARRRDFVGWLGELLVPRVVLARALEGHPNVAVSFRYDARESHVSFVAGHAPAHAQSATINLHNGWSVSTFAAPLATGVLRDWHALTLLIGGMLLSLLFGLLVAALASGRRRALALVHEKTRELSHLALHDALTGLPNRALVLDRAQQMLARTARRPGTYAGALFIDIDGFKHVNDNLGHAAGDQLLKVVGERLQSTVRDDDTVGRLGGDEFVVLVESASGEAVLNVLADRLTEVLREPVELRDGRKLFSVTASIGVAIGHYDTPDALLRDADLALYSAKAAGKDRYALFDASMYEGVEDRLALEADLASALQSDQFFVLYQPIFELDSGQLVEVEALVRWRHPERGVILPERFIPLAEDSGMIIPVGRWVLDQACRQAAIWRSHGLAVGIAVNVSAHQLGRRGFIDDVRNALRDAALEPSQLTLEITETTLTGDIVAASEHLAALKELGVRIAIDDFGTGYASLSQLRRIPVDVLKIDRSFVAALTEVEGRALLEAVVGVGRALSLTVIAEGIEEPEQLAALKEMGCEMAQGFLLGEPVEASAVEALLCPVAVRRFLSSATP